VCDDTDTVSYEIDETSITVGERYGIYLQYGNLYGRPSKRISADKWYAAGTERLFYLYYDESNESLLITLVYLNLCLYILFLGKK
jgi:hypothetical protein